MAGFFVAEIETTGYQVGLAEIGKAVSFEDTDGWDVVGILTSIVRRGDEAIATVGLREFKLAPVTSVLVGMEES